MKATNKEISREVANCELAPLIDFTQRSGVDLILKMLNERIKKYSERQNFPLRYREVNMTQIRSWLHFDVNERIEPMFGIGLLLLDVWRDLQKGVVMDKSKSVQRRAQKRI